MSSRLSDARVRMLQEEARSGEGRSYTNKGWENKFANKGNSKRGGDMLI